jgi:flagellar biosynthesis/type III secretory pathway protein FliH
LSNFKPPPMTLPKETIEKIKKDAHSKSYAKVKGSFESAYGMGFRSGYETGHEEGATEWAGKAQGLTMALAELRIKLYTCKDERRELDHDYAIVLIETALAKYKEVGNG